MENPSRNGIFTSSGVNLVFALVVMSSFFSTFSVLQTASALEIVLLVLSGTAYILMGIYGFGVCMAKDSLKLKVAYFAIQIPLGGLLVYLGRGSGFNAILLLPLAGHGVMLMRRGWLDLTNIGILSAYALAIFISKGGWQALWMEMPIFLAGQVFIVIFTQMAVDEKHASSEGERLAERLEEANQRLRNYALQIEELAISKERNRLAREIHDGLGHYLTSINMQIRASQAVREKDARRADEALEKARLLTQQALTDVRGSVSALRTDPAESLPLAEMIAETIKNCEVAGVEAVFRTLGIPRPISPQAHLTLFRAAQEGVNNICKHAQADHAWITLDYCDTDHILLTVQDNGKGSTNTDGGFGIMGLRERVHLLNGELNISSAEGQGLSLEIKVPE
ncbi:MAG: sensor histidine kinase [Anaerolineaceae bacterium]|jgi:signal transduction histidine kinase|nr:sensor histidine kinase [Anaerolineaceae bacterium]